MSNLFSKIFNNQSKTITGAALIIAGATFISRLVGLLRDRIFAHYYGAGEMMDAYYAAFKIPDLVYNLLILGALSAGFIPVFTKIFDKNKRQGWQMANNVINVAGLTLIVVCGLGMIFAPQLSPLIAPGFETNGLELTGRLARIMFLSPLFLGLSMIFGGILQSLRQFLIYSLAPIFYNLGIIFGAAVLVRWIGPTGLAWGVVLGALMHLILQKIGAYCSGWRWQRTFDFKDQDLRIIGKLMIPRTLGLATSQLNILVLTMLASLLPAGSVAVYNYANNLQGVAVGIIGIPFALSVFPVLSKYAGRGRKDKFVENLSATIRKILFLIIPASILIMLLRAQIVRVVLGTGQFDWAATIATADALAFFALSLFAQSLIPLLARGFYSLENTKTPFVIALVSEIITIIFAFMLYRPMGVAGLALAVSAGAVINMLSLGFSLRKTLGFIDGEKILKALYKISIAGILMGITIQFLKYPLAKVFDQDYFWGIFGQGFLAGMGGLVIYAVICYILRLEEYVDLQDSLKKKFLNIKNLPTEIDTKQ